VVKRADSGGPGMSDAESVIAITAYSSRDAGRGVRPALFALFSSTRDALRRAISFVDGLVDGTFSLTTGHRLGPRRSRCSGS